MKTIDLHELKDVNGGVVDPGNGQGCTRSGGCIPNPWQQPGQSWPLPGGDIGSQGLPFFGGGPLRPGR